MLFLILVCVALAFTSMNLVATIIAVVLWIVIHPLLVWMGMVDPQLVGVYLRSQKYPGYIRPFTTPFRKHVGYRIPSADASWKFWRR